MQSRPNPENFRRTGQLTTCQEERSMQLYGQIRPLSSAGGGKFHRIRITKEVYQDLCQGRGVPAPSRVTGLRSGLTPHGWPGSYDKLTGSA